MSDWNFEGMTTKSCENDEDYYQHQIDYFIALEQKNQEEREKWEANGRKGKYSQYYLHHLSFMPEEGTPYSLNYSEKTLKEQLKTLETDLKASSLDPFDKMGVYNAIQRLLDAQPLEADDIERWDAPRLFQPNYFGFGTTRVADDGTPIYETVMAPQGVTLFASVEAARRTGMLAFTDTGNEKAFIIYSNGKGKYWLGPLKHGTRDHIEIGLGEQPGVIEEICHSHYGSDPSEKDIQTAILAAAYNQRTYGINRSAVSHYDMNSGKWDRVEGVDSSASNLSSSAQGVTLESMERHKPGDPAPDGFPPVDPADMKRINDAQSHTKHPEILTKPAANSEEHNANIELIDMGVKKLVVATLKEAAGALAVGQNPKLSLPPSLKHLQDFPGYHSQTGDLIYHASAYESSISGKVLVVTTPRSKEVLLKDKDFHVLVTPDDERLKVVTRIARDAIQEYRPERVIFVGYSGGGADATIQAVATQAQALVFNPMGLEPEIYEKYQGDKLNADQLVTTVVVQGDDLTGAQDAIAGEAKESLALISVISKIGDMGKSQLLDILHVPTGTTASMSKLEQSILNVITSNEFIEKEWKQQFRGRAPGTRLYIDYYDENNKPISAVLYPKAHGLGAVVKSISRYIGNWGENVPKGQLDKTVLNQTFTIELMTGNEEELNPSGHRRVKITVKHTTPQSHHRHQEVTYHPTRSRPDYVGHRREKK